ncbi:hypothetical protein ACF09Y_21040 [Streptomyces massasporeus]|uniref:hypothetical protein n=1 Tax=Streptomyces massasporeus TaxID=67324 RepID=UPI0036FED127
MTAAVLALEAVGALPGGGDPARIPAELADAWPIRDRSSSTACKSPTRGCSASPARRSAPTRSRPVPPLGCGVHFVDHLPTADRPDGLRPFLDPVS